MIAIIAILAALLLPALSRAKATALRVQCMSNLKQLQSGWQLQMLDNNDYMPPNIWNGVPAEAAGNTPGCWVVGNARETTPTNIETAFNGLITLRWESIIVRRTNRWRRMA